MSDQRPVNIVAVADICALYNTKPDQFDDGTLFLVVSEGQFFRLNKTSGKAPGVDVVSVPYGPAQPGCVAVADNFGGVDTARYERLITQPLAHAEQAVAGNAVSIPGDGAFHDIFSFPIANKIAGSIIQLFSSLTVSLAQPANVVFRWLVDGDVASGSASAPGIRDAVIAVDGFTPSLAVAAHTLKLQASVTPTDIAAPMLVAAGSTALAQEVGAAG